MEPFQLKEKEALFLTEWQQEVPHLVAGFSTRNGGRSKDSYASLNLGLHVKDRTEDVLHNRNTLADVIGITVDNWVGCEQVHRAEVTIISKKDKGKGARRVVDAIEGIDGLISNNSSVLATAFFADCVPLFFVDPVTGWFGVAHAGWKGTVSEIGREMVQCLNEQGVKSKNIKVAIGPSISKGHYEVDKNVINEIRKTWQKEVATPQVNDKYLLDLKKLNKLILEEAGVREEYISISSYCTYQDEDLFFSHRRDKGKTGRMLGFIGFSEQ